MTGNDLGNAMAAAVLRVVLIGAAIALAIGIGIGYACGGEPVELPIQTVSADEEAGILFNRKDKQKPEGDCPGGVCPRTQPVDPLAPASPATPQFESEPIPPAGDVTVDVVPEPNTTDAKLTPEQKKKLGEILVQVATFLAGAFMGSGSASPFIKMILEKLLSTVGGAAAPAPARTAARRRVLKKK